MFTLIGTNPHVKGNFPIFVDQWGKIPYKRDMTNDEDDDFDGESAKEFAKNRREWIRHVMADGDILPTYRLIAIAIALRVNYRTEKSWPSTKRIAEDTATGLRTVIRAIKFLEDKKLLEVTHRKRGVNRYEMLYPWR